MVRSQRPSQPPLRPRPAKQVAPNSKARGSDGACTSAPSAKRRKTGRDSGAAASAAQPQQAGADPEVCEDIDAEVTSEGGAAGTLEAEAMDLGAGSSLGSRRGADSASASNTPSDEAPASGGPGRGSSSSESSRFAGRSGPSSADFSNALGSFLRRASQMEENSGGGSSRFSSMFRDLKSDDGNRQIMALTELSEYLSFSSEEALIAFPMETFIPILIGLLEDPGHSDETAAQAMVLCCRCLFNVVDILPPTTRIIIAAGGLPVLCANLLNVAYIDVAELAVAIIERISDDQPLQVLKAGGLQAILTFLDFFQIAVQRQAASAAALMLLPVPPPDVFEQHVRPVLPTLSQLLQHVDPQVLQSICECWRRVLDNTVLAQLRGPRTSTAAISSTASSLGRMVVKGKWRGGPADRGRKERGGAGADEGMESSPPAAAASFASSAPSAGPTAPSASPSRPLSASLEEMCPSSALSNFMALLANGIASPSPQTSLVTSEVLYIVSALTNYSDKFTKEVLQQDICSALRKATLATDLGQGSAAGQSSFSLLRVLGAVASMLPAMHLTDTGCECDEKRLALFQECPSYLEQFGEAFLPVLIDVYEASTDPCVQSLSVTVLLALFLACRSRPEIIRKSLEPTRVACFLANLLFAGVSRSLMLACLLVVHELLERHPDTYSFLFVRHGVVRAIHRVVTRDEESQRKVVRATTKSPELKGKASRSRGQLLEEVAHRVLSSYFATSSHTGESAILRALGKIAKQLRSSPDGIIAAHRDAFNKLHDLLLSSDSITAFEFMCSGTAGALNAFLYPNGGSYSERLRLFLDCLCKSPNGAFTKLVRLTASAVHRIEQLPLALFPTHASLMATLPPHLRIPQASGTQGGKGDGAGNVRALGLGGDLASSLGGSRGRRHDAGHSSSASLSVLRLLAKPVRVRMAPSGTAPQPPGQNAALHNFRTLLMPFGPKSSPPRLLTDPRAGGGSGGPPSMNPATAAAATAGLSNVGGASSSHGSTLSKVGAPPAAAAAAAAGAEPTQLAAASPAARLRNFLAAKVSRKRSVSSAGSAASSSVQPSEKRSGMAVLLSKGRSSSSASAAQPQVDASDSRAPSRQQEDSWASASWEEEDEEGSATPAGRGVQDQAGSSRGVGGSGPRGPGEPRFFREFTAESLEALLLVEPLALVSALEEYIWERHGPKRNASADAAATGSASAGTGPTTSAACAGEAAAAAVAASTAQSAAASECTTARSGGPGSSAAGKSSGSSAVPAAPEGARVRLSVKQPALGTPRSMPLEAQTGGSPRTPLANIDSETPSFAQDRSASSSRVMDSESPPSEGEQGATGAEVRALAKAVAAPRERKRVQIYLHGAPLDPKTSVVQALVKNASRIPRSVGRTSSDGLSRGRGERFLVCTEEDSGSDRDDGGEHLRSVGHMSSRHFCDAIWGRVHSMTCEFVDETSSAQDAAATPSAEVVCDRCPVVATEFDELVCRHDNLIESIAALQVQNSAAMVGARTASSASAVAGASGTIATPQQEEPGTGELLTPGSPRSKVEGDAGDRLPESANDKEALSTVLQLLSAFYNIREFILVSQGPLTEGMVDDEDFHASSLTSKMMRQLADPLAICTGSIPPWCTKLAGKCRFLFPSGARRALHHSCNLGLSRALHYVQQRTLAQSAPSQEAQRRLEGEVAVASIPRQKVRISRQRILESAVKVMNLYGSSNTILEVEYVGEVGTGSGPTLEFYAQVAEILRTAEPRLFRQGTPAGLLFPEPRSPQAMRSGGEMATQVLERFRLLGHTVAKCILDNRLVDMQLHPFFWRAVLGRGPFSQRSLREVDPELYSSLNELRRMDDESLKQLCVDFTLPGRSQIELKPGGSNIGLERSNVEEYISLVTKASLVTTVAPQVAAFRAAFAELLPLETCSIWSEKELASIIVGSSVHDDSVWTLEHLSSHIKAQHGYNSDSRVFRDLLNTMTAFTTDERRCFLTFVTGAPTLPSGGFGGLKPPLTVVKKEAPPAPLTPDQFMPSVMTCANYLKLPEYSSEDILKQKLDLAVSEGQSAFLLS